MRLRENWKWSIFEFSIQFQFFFLSSINYTLYNCAIIQIRINIRGLVTIIINCIVAKKMQMHFLFPWLLPPGFLWVLATPRLSLVASLINPETRVVGRRWIVRRIESHCFDTVLRWIQLDRGAWSLIYEFFTLEMKWFLCLDWYRCVTVSLILLKIRKSQSYVT